ncbi:MAG: aminotransferase class III-fold pyridoxal phosphate-dependent enzyme, partial [Bacillota bacterium]
ALATLDVILNDGVLDNVKEVSAYLIQRLQELQASTGAIADIRGRGLMVGIELKEAKAAAVLAACRKKGLLVHCAGDKTLRLLPPLIIEKSDVDEALRILCGVLSELQ